MIATWYTVLAVMLVMYVVLEGFDIGAGMLQPLVGKTEDERRLVIAAIGPLWSWHEVWLVGFGGTLLLAFPAVMAASFAGFYLALMLLLWCLILRGVSIEFSGHVTDPLWRAAWHFVFVASNLLLAVLIGAALGNVVRGVPLDENHKFTLAFFTTFDPRGNVGILDWYTVSVAAFMVATFAAHGANGLMLKTTGPVHGRSLRLARIFGRVAVALLVVVTAETDLVRPEVFQGMAHKPFAWFGVACVVVGLITVSVGIRGKRQNLAFPGSCLFIAGLMIAGAASVFPEMLHSTLTPENSMTAYQSAAAGNGLKAAIFWWPIAAVFAVLYMLFIYKYYSGKVEPGQDTQQPY